MVNVNKADARGAFEKATGRTLPPSPPTMASTPWVRARGGIRPRSGASPIFDYFSAVPAARFAAGTVAGVDDDVIIAKRAHEIQLGSAAYAGDRRASRIVDFCSA